jgi:hypothetical protein
MNYPLLILFSSISALLPFLASTLSFKYTDVRSKNIVFLWIFFILSVVTEIALYILNSQHKQSAWIFHIYTVIEYILIMMILASWQSKIPMSKLMRISIPIYIFLFVIIKVIGLENFETGLYNNITRPLAVLLLSTFAFITLQDLWSYTSSNITNDYRFWTQWYISYTISCLR